MAMITAEGFHILNEEYRRWSEVYDDCELETREAFESLFELIGMFLKDYSDMIEEQWNDELLDSQEREDFAQ
jgi:hypothetical protein